jgi:hypothetical protein
MQEKKLKSLPRFASEDEEREFWATHDSGEYVDWSKSEVITDPHAFPKLKLTEGLISLTIDDASARELKSLAKKRKVDLSVLAAQYVQEGIQRDVRRGIQ